MIEQFLGGRITLHCGDMREILTTLPENSVDSCCCDPPYHLTSIVKRFGAEDAAPAKSNGATGVYGRASSGFMGKVWDGGDIAFDPETWRAVLRVLKPGAHLLAMGGTRTYHRLACAIEDAGFDVRDCIAWVYGVGFPKSHDVSKGIDRAAGAEREVSGPSARHNSYSSGSGNTVGFQIGIPMETIPATDAAREWQGWGTALKPAMELIILARKPLSEATIAANVLKWGTGAINVDRCRIGTDIMGGYERTGGKGSYLQPSTQREMGYRPKWDRADSAFAAKEGTGRWPANLIHDGSDEVRAAFPDVHGAGAACENKWPCAENVNVYGKANDGMTGARFGDEGSAARFFYTSKADADDRLGSKHPTVKPLDLMQYLCRLVCRKGGTILDCFAGTGTTGEAAWREGMSAVLVEAEAEYCEDIRRRMALVLSGPDERTRESIKAKGLPRDDGPLFAAAE